MKRGDDITEELQDYIDEGKLKRLQSQHNAFQHVTKTLKCHKRTIHQMLEDEAARELKLEGQI